MLLYRFEKKDLEIIHETFNIEFNGRDFQPKLSSFFGVPNEPDMDSTISSMDKTLTPKPIFCHNTSFIPSSVELKTHAKKQIKSNSTELYLKKDIFTPSTSNTMPKDVKSSYTELMKYVQPVELSRVCISHVDNPNKFFVQLETFYKITKQFIGACSRESLYALKPEIIVLDTMYLIQLQSNDCWYRGRILKELPNGAYVALYVDFGWQEQVNINRYLKPKIYFSIMLNYINNGLFRIREISEDLASRPYGAVECSIYGIAPKETQWSDEAKQIMFDIISKYDL